MSRFDAEHEAEWKRQQEQDARDFVVGAVVYRAHYDHVQEGIVREVDRTDRTDAEYDGHANGKYARYVAEFRRPGAAAGDWEHQTYSWRFFATKSEALRELVERIDGQILDAEREVEKLRKLRESVKKELTCPAS